MKCRSCKRDIPENSLFCNWCGEKQIKEKKKKEISVPKPQHRSSGLWIASMMINGTRTTVSAQTEAEYYAKARALKAGLIESAAPAPRKTLDNVVSSYISDRSRILSPTTLRSYQSYWKNHFLRYHDKQVVGINFQRMVNEEAADTEPNTLRKCWTLVATALRSQGIETYVKLPAVPKHERAWLSDAEIAVFLDAVKGRDCELTALLALHSLRESEIAGLQWEDYNGASVTVHQALVRSQSGMVMKDTPKSAAGNRTVPVFIPRLKELLDAVPENERTGAIVSTRVRTDSERIKRLCLANDLPPCTNHCLRHSFATLCHRLGVPLLDTKRMGGWNDLGTLQNIYTHLDAQDALTTETALSAFYNQITTNSAETP